MLACGHPPYLCALLEPLATSPLRDERDQPIEAPFKRLFLPLAKIDYYVIL